MPTSRARLPGGVARRRRTEEPILNDRIFSRALSCMGWADSPSRDNPGLSISTRLADRCRNYDSSRKLSTWT
jgi:hypothetical protein